MTSDDLMHEIEHLRISLAASESRAAAAEGALGECRAVLAEVAHRWCPHSGLCCRCVDGRIFVTEETCECDELHRKVQRIAGIEPYEAAAREGRKA